MLSGEVIGLRARLESDVPVLHRELYDDVEVHSRANARAWRPIPAGSPASPFVPADPSDNAAIFSVVQLADDALAGEATLWAIDTHNRRAHVGISLRPAFRGRGLGADVVRVLCRYAFVTLGLHRLQVDTLADNVAMIRAAQRAGFTLEGTLRGAAWVDGAFVDEVILGRCAGATPDRPDRRGGR